MRSGLSSIPPLGGASPSPDYELETRRSFDVCCQRWDGGTGSHLLHERCPTPAVTRIEAVRFVDEEDLTDGLVHDFLGLVGGLPYESGGR